MSGKRIHLSVTESTNLYTSRKISQSDIEPWTMVTADYQASGKGQRGRTWDSEPGKNLLASVYFEPQIEARRQFLISAAASIAVVQTLQRFHIGAEVKWPNDILVNRKKIAGLLIQNQVESQHIQSTVVGLGLNINQTHFDRVDWPATSMGLEMPLEDRLVPGEVGDIFLKELRSIWERKVPDSSLVDAFEAKLFGRGENVIFEYGNDRFTGLMKGVSQDGALIIEAKGGVIHYSSGQIKLRYNGA